MLVKLEHFGDGEFACSCCTTNEMNAELLVKLQNLRYLCGFALIINSAFRCEKNNKNAGGVSGSRHLRGDAVDISIKKLSSKQKYELLKNALGVGFLGAGIYKNHLHLDAREKKTCWVK